MLKMKTWGDVYKEDIELYLIWENTYKPFKAKLKTLMNQTLTLS